MNEQFISKYGILLLTSLAAFFLPHTVNARSNSIRTFERNKSSHAILKKMEMLRRGCSEICDHTITGQPTKFWPFIKKKVNCNELWANTAIDDSRKLGSTAPEMPIEMRGAFLYDEAVKFIPWSGGTLNQQYLGGDAMVSFWSRELIDGMKKQCADGTLRGNYGLGDTSQLLAALKYADRVKGGDILVIGSESPWVEACCLAAGAKTVTTLEYGLIRTTHPQVKTFTPEKMRKMFLNKSLGQFDAIVTFSSIEHSGLGRYGDSLNPWGDRQTVARGWCVAKPEANLLIAVPTTGFMGSPEAIQWNAHRVYGPLMYSHLVANWFPKKEFRSPEFQSTFLLTRSD